MAPSDKDMVAAIQKLMDAASKLSAMWGDIDSTEVPEAGYPSYLPSFDEFANDLVLWHDAAAEKAGL